jgi:hypothetical protein
MEKQLEQIKHFMTLLRAGHLENNEHAPLEINSEPTLAHIDCNARLITQLLEEVFEIKVASNNSDLEEAIRKALVLDGCVDALVVLLQIIIANGLHGVIETAFDRVVENNLSKFPNGKGTYNKEGKLMKPEGFKPVVLIDLV